MAQAVVTPGAVPALTAVQVRFRRAPEAPPDTPAGEAALPPLFLDPIWFWDEHQHTYFFRVETIAHGFQIHIQRPPASSF